MWHVNRPFVCTICNRKFSFPHLLKDHVAIHYNERAFKCKICNKGFKTKNDLRKHGYTHKCQSMKDKWICKICKHTLSTRTGIRKHCQTIHPNNTNQFYKA